MCLKKDQTGTINMSPIHNIH